MKPQCRSIQRCLSDYIDYTLSARQTIIVAQHLRFCRDCQLELKALRRTEALLRVHVPPQPPEGYYDQFGEQLQQLIEKRPRPIWWGVAALSQAIAWRFQEFLHQSIKSFSKLISFPIGWVKTVSRLCVDAAHHSYQSVCISSLPIPRARSFQCCKLVAGR